VDGLGGEGAATEPALTCFTYPGGTADGKKKVNEYTAIVYIRLNANMIKSKKKRRKQTCIQRRKQTSESKQRRKQNTASKVKSKQQEKQPT